MILDKDTLKNHTSKLGYSYEQLLQMNVGDAYPIGNTLNKIKRQGEDVWLFIRKDSIKTHIHNETVKSNAVKKIWQNLKDSRNYNLRYAEDRCKAIEQGFDVELVTDLVSTPKYINEQVKSTTSPLSGEYGFTKTLSMMADYIVFAKFDNKQQEEKHENNKEEIRRLEKIHKNKRKEQEKKLLTKYKEDLKKHPSSYTKTPNKPPKHFRIKSLEEAFEESHSNGLRVNESKVNYVRVDRQLEQGKYHEDMKAFWNRFSPNKDNDIPFYTHTPIKYNKLAYETMKQYIDEIKYLEGLQHTTDRQKQISNLKSEMRTALEALRKTIHFQPTTNIGETIPNNSWEYLNLRNVNTYRALLLGYYEAIRKYSSKPSTSFWALLQDFKQLIESIEWTPEEAIIIEFIIETGVTEAKKIQDELYTYLGIEVSNQNISNWINKYIPNKLHKAYEKQLEDWIWIYRRKGIYKTCSCCGETKLAVDSRYFSKNKTGKYGLSSQCKACRNK